MPVLSDFAIFILAYREDNHLSQRELAEKIGTTQTIISWWERGNDNPRYETLVKISRALHVPVTHMFPIDCI